MSSYRKSFPRFSLLIVLAATVWLSTPLCADVKMSDLFGDHMVLQQDSKLPVWGWADPGEAVTVTVGGSTAKTTTGADGQWRVDLPPVPKGSPAQTMTVVGKNTLTFSDVLIGDVWICSGQSNMEYGIGKTADQDANNPNIRIFWVIKNAALNPQDHFGDGAPERPLYGKWQVCSTNVLGQDGSWNGFSAVGYYFAQNIQKVTQHPVGMIGSYWGGTPAQAWTSLPALEGNPALSHYADTVKNLKPDQKGLFPANWVTYDVAGRKWDAANQAVVKPWQDEVAKAKAEGQPVPPPPPIMATKPRNPGNIATPSTLFNGMINPLIPYAIKGVIWYQGESNEGTASEYATLFPAMIMDWRSRWALGDFPFLFVQLANYDNPKDPNSVNWPVVREAQFKTLSQPNTGMAVTIDIGDPGNIHPKDKADVGARLALAARHLAYGEDIVYSGPIYDSMTVEGSKIRVSFKNIGGGLMMGVPPWTPDGKPVPPPTALTGFEVAGTDKKWVAADAMIDGATVVISSTQVSAPLAARYAWAPNPVCDLYNKEGLPASPFRTDSSF